MPSLPNLLYSPGGDQNKDDILAVRNATDGRASTTGSDQEMNLCM